MARGRAPANSQASPQHHPGRRLLAGTETSNMGSSLRSNNDVDVLVLITTYCVSCSMYHQYCSVATNTRLIAVTETLIVLRSCPCPLTVATTKFSQLELTFVEYSPTEARPASSFPSASAQIFAFRLGHEWSNEALTLSASCNRKACDHTFLSC